MSALIHPPTPGSAPKSHKFRNQAKTGHDNNHTTRSSPVPGKNKTTSRGFKEYINTEWNTQCHAEVATCCRVKDAFTCTSMLDSAQALCNQIMSSGLCITFYCAATLFTQTCPNRTRQWRSFSTSDGRTPVLPDAQEGTNHTARVAQHTACNVNQRPTKRSLGGSNSRP